MRTRYSCALVTGVASIQNGSTVTALFGSDPAVLGDLRAAAG